MKKIIMCVAFVMATVGVSQANIQKTNKLAKTNAVVTASDVVALNDSTPYVVSFYDVERIVIKNNEKVRIRVYDSNWKLISDTNNDVNLFVIPGNYYVACEKRIKTHFVAKR